jgi:hypothetical protein
MSALLHLALALLYGEPLLASGGGLFSAKLNKRPEESCKQGQGGPQFLFGLTVRLKSDGTRTMRQGSRSWKPYLPTR